MLLLEAPPRGWWPTASLAGPPRRSSGPDQGNAMPRLRGLQSPRGSNVVPFWAVYYNPYKKKIGPNPKGRGVPKWW